MTNFVKIGQFVVEILRFFTIAAVRYLGFVCAIFGLPT